MSHADILSKIENPPKSWNPVPDEIIDAYFAGTEKGIQDVEVAIAELARDKAGKAFDFAEKAATALNGEIGLNCSQVRLRRLSLVDFETIYIVSLNGYLTDARKAAYSLFRSMKAKAFEDNKIHIDFKLMPEGEVLNIGALVSDGFYYSFSPNG